VSDEGFLARWSRRKAGIPAPDDANADARTPAQPPPAPAATADAGALSPPAAPTEPAQPADAPPAMAPPTLADVAALTRDSDYARFMAPGVDGAVRNAAMKKLFSDPRFNVMDGLDTYIDDYNKPDPLPLAMLRKLRQSEMLGLFADEATDGATAAAAAAEASPDNRATSMPAASPSPATPTSPSAPSRAQDDPDLRLQPDDGDRRPGAGEGPRA